VSGRFGIRGEDLDARIVEQLRRSLDDASCGGFVCFEGRVRDYNEGHSVVSLEYEAFEPLALKEGERILGEARERFGIERVLCVHRVGALSVGDVAVWVGVNARHRGEAFAACRYIIDEVKHRVPIWKKERYADGQTQWVNCAHCAAHGHEHKQHDQHDP